MNFGLVSLEPRHGKGKRNQINTANITAQVFFLERCSLIERNIKKICNEALYITLESLLSMPATLRWEVRLVLMFAVDNRQRKSFYLFYARFFYFYGNLSPSAEENSENVRAATVATRLGHDK